MLQSAEAGHREAQFQCAMRCFRGDVGPKDFEGGKRWLAKAAENGWAKAEFALFQLYYYGFPPVADCPAYPKDKTQAIKWLRRAAEHENLKAQSTLAVMLIRGTDLEQNKMEAEQMLRNAAQHGYAPGQNDLGFAILNGDLGTRNLVEAAMWCQLAEARSTDTNTTQRAKFNSARASSQLSEEEQHEVSLRLKKYQPLSIAEQDPMIKNWENNPDYEQEDGHFGH
jgi:hypothetical protein